MLRYGKTLLVILAMTTTAMVASDILLTVNGKNITKQDAQMFVSATAPNVNFQDLNPEDKKMVLNRLVEKILFTELAEKEGIDKKQEFQKNMLKIRDELLVNMWMKMQLDNAIVSDSEAKEFYTKNADKFMEKASMHARHILLKEEKEAQDIIDTLKAFKGEALKTKFIELAKEKSTGPSGPQGGDLGTFSTEQMVPEFSKATWALNNGEMTTSPVKTQFGYHVIYLEKKSDEKPTSYESVKEKIIISLKQKQFNEKVTEIAKELKSKAKIIDTIEEKKVTK